ncbi:DinB family protein [Arthrobacter zhaoguopingii]|uniref:DinB family protein n=1 Tax=Arthrobacter zhaoguopingii TaxID=2681491 RepID=UPI00135AE6D1|nr:DinB family protein [Arthrobacter zhaoguopingii]
MTTVDDQGRVEPPLAGTEAETLLGYLDYQRATLAWKAGGLDAAGLSATVGVSALTLGGLLKHMSFVEDHWFTYTLHGQDRQPPWDAVDWKTDPDWEWHSAAGDAPGELLSLWEGTVGRSRSLTTQAIRAGGLDQRAQRPWASGEAPSLRWILVHMIEEYARHNGHADLLRESVDGSTGE